MSRIEDNVCKKIQERAKIGFKKYGKTMEREDFSRVDWFNYLQEELMDALVYTERLIEELTIEETADRLMGEHPQLVEMEEEEPGMYKDKKNIFDQLKDYRQRLGK